MFCYEQLETASFGDEKSTTLSEVIRQFFLQKLSETREDHVEADNCSSGLQF